MRRLKTQVIVNPESNQGRTRKRWLHIKEAFRGFLKDYRCEFTGAPLEAIEITRSALRDGTELVIGVGGDGTLNEIGNGFFEDRRPINPQAALGIVPSGSGCDLARSLGIPKSLEGALRVIVDGPSTSIDVGKATFRTPAGRDEERFFLNIADFGVGGEVVARVNRNRLERRASSYVRCLVTTMARYRSRRLSVRVDGRALPSDSYLIGAVANGRIFGKGMKVAPEARLDDGLFDLVLVRGMKFLEFCRHGWRLINGSHLSHPKISLVRGRRIEAFPEDPDPVLLELDGEQLGSLPAAFEVAPRHIVVKGYAG
jgi:YegS/Rv2252/BmrU family lipid kinase